MLQERVKRVHSLPLPKLIFLSISHVLFVSAVLGYLLLYLGAHLGYDTATREVYTLWPTLLLLGSYVLYRKVRGDVDFFDALERCLPRLAEVHLHDAPIPASQEAIVYGKDHSVLGTGDLDLARFLDRLSAAGFDGPIIFELTVEEALTSLDVIRAVHPSLV